MSRRAVDCLLLSHCWCIQVWRQLGMAWTQTSMQPPLLKAPLACCMAALACCCRMLRARSSTPTPSALGRAALCLFPSQGPFTSAWSPVKAAVAVITCRIVDATVCLLICLSTCCCQAVECVPLMSKLNRFFCITSIYSAFSSDISHQLQVGLPRNWPRAQLSERNWAC